MAITVNGETHPWREGLTVEQLLVEKKFSFPLKTVFINGQRVDREAYQRTAIRDGDQVHVLHLMSGG